MDLKSPKAGLEKRDREAQIRLETDRSTWADEIYSQACEASGIKISSWDQFDGWKKFVDGEITESQLRDEARSNVEEYAAAFGKYVVMQKEKDGHHEGEDEKRARARRANQIYRRACHDAGLTVRFFKDFSTWSDYVNGRIGDEKFYAKVLEELSRLRSTAA
jgi:hypothetical protein